MEQSFDDIVAEIARDLRGMPSPSDLDAAAEQSRGETSEEA